MNAPKYFQAIVFTSILSANMPATAITDAEFNNLQNQLEQLAEALEQQNTSSNTTHIGGYGELHINSLSNPSGPRKQEIDFHRFIIFLNHEFSDDIRLFSEVEIEHAFLEDTDTDGTTVDTSPGALELEQAYLQFDINESQNINAGLFLLPVGIINETHEPPTFYGTERNPVEKNIIPTTWWEGGVMWSGRNNNGFSLDIALTSGLSTGTNIRDGRQKVAKAEMDHLALTTRIKYTGIAGLEIAASLQQQDDITQDSSDNIDGALLTEAHVIWNIEQLTIKALFAQWNIDGAGAEASEKDKQKGAYLEAGYKFTSRVGVFARHNIWDNGGVGDTEKTQNDFGINYWPHEDVVIKLDYQSQDENAGDNDGINIGIGYQF